MAAISVVLAADVPFVYWQRIASRTWFETNIQVIPKVPLNCPWTCP